MTGAADAATLDAIRALRRAAPPGRRLGALLLGAVLLAVASFASLDLPWRSLASRDALAGMGRFVAEFFPPDVSARFLARVAVAAWETLAMSALGTGLAAAAGLAIAVAASRVEPGERARPWQTVLRWLSNVLRAIPELVWAALLLIAAGLGPFAGTLALALHTSGVLARLFTEAIENAPRGPGAALRVHGVGRVRVFLFAVWPQIVPQLVSYTLYRWENNIRAAAVLGVVGAGGLGQMLAFHMGLFQMARTSTVIGAMLVLVALVDGASALLRRAMTR